MTNVILIDTRIVTYQNIVAGVNNNTIAVVFDYSTDTYNTLLDKILDLDLNSITNIALASHGEFTETYKMLDNEQECQVQFITEKDPTFASWNTNFNFWLTLRNLYQIENIDLLACALVSHDEWKNILVQMEQFTSTNVRASDDETGNLKEGGDWVLETDNVNVKNLYFNDTIDEFVELLGGSTSMPQWGRNSTDDNANIYKNYINITGSVVSGYGDSAKGADITGLYPSGSDLDNIATVYSTDRSYAALKTDGSVVCWGEDATGGSFATHYPDDAGDADLASGISKIYTTRYSFAAVTTAGKVYTWGWSGGGSTYATHYPNTAGDADLASGVISIASSLYAFAALKSDGSVICWGTAGYGESFATHYPDTYGDADLASGVSEIYSTERAFCALKTDGSVITWGSETLEYGSRTGSASTTHYPTSDVLTSGVSKVFTNNRSFFALKTDNTLVRWGYLANQLIYTDHGSQAADNTLSGMSNIGFKYGASDYGVTVISDSGEVYAWAGSASKLLNARRYNTSTTGDLSSLANNVASTSQSFAILKTDGETVIFGHNNNGGEVLTQEENDDNGFLLNCVKLISSQQAFCMLKNDGSVQTRGHVSYGGDHADASWGIVSGSVSSGVVDIYANNDAFVALKDNGDTISWGNSTYGGRITETGNTNPIRIFGNAHSFITCQPTVITTVLKTSVAAGVTTIEIMDDPGFTVGGVFVIDEGTPIEEIRTIASISSLNFDDPLDYAHGSGAPIEEGLAAAAAAPCILTGSKILTPDGEVYIDDLNIGDLVVSNKVKKIKDIKIYNVIYSKEHYPWKIPKGKFGCTEDLYLSASHCIMLNGFFVETRYLKNIWRIRDDPKFTNTKKLKYYHIVLDDFLEDYVIANGVKVETLCTKEQYTRTGFYKEFKKLRIYSIHLRRLKNTNSDIKDILPFINKELKSILRRKIAMNKEKFLSF